MSPNLRQVQNETARNQQAMRNLDALPWAPRPGSHFRALGWMLVTVVILTGLMGLFVVGGR